VRVADLRPSPCPLPEGAGHASGWAHNSFEIGFRNECERTRHVGRRRSSLASRLCSSIHRDGENNQRREETPNSFLEHIVLLWGNFDVHFTTGPAALETTAPIAGVIIEHHV